MQAKAELESEAERAVKMEEEMKSRIGEVEGKERARRQEEAEERRLAEQQLGLVMEQRVKEAEELVAHAKQEAAEAVQVGKSRKSSKTRMHISISLRTKCYKRADKHADK